MTAYIFAELQVTDKSVFKQHYVPAALQAVSLYGGRFVSTGRCVSFRIGPSSPDSRTVLIAFPDYAAANAFYDSPEYIGASDIRSRCATTFKYVIVGEDGESVSLGQ